MQIIGVALFFSAPFCRLVELGKKKASTHFVGAPMWAHPRESSHLICNLVFGGRGATDAPALPLTRAHGVCPTWVCPQTGIWYPQKWVGFLCFQPNTKPAKVPSTKHPLSRSKGTVVVCRTFKDIGLYHGRLTLLAREEARHHHHSSGEERRRDDCQGNKLQAGQSPWSGYLGLKPSSECSNLGRLLKGYILQPFETCCFFNTNIKGHHHFQVAMCRCMPPDPCWGLGPFLVSAAQPGSSRRPGFWQG